MPDDGYLYDHLVQLLLDSDKPDEARQLFGDDRWFQARVAQGGCGSPVPWRVPGHYGPWPLN